MYDTHLYKTPCPQCGAAKAVRWSGWDADCRGNDGGYHIQCEKCEATYTREVWVAIAHDEIEGPRKKRAKIVEPEPEPIVEPDERDRAMEARAGAIALRRKMWWDHDYDCNFKRKKGRTYKGSMEACSLTAMHKHLHGETWHLMPYHITDGHW